MSKSARIANWMGALLACGLVACTLEARMGTGGARSPEGQPSAAPGRRGGEPAGERAKVKVAGARVELPGPIAFEPGSAQLAPGSEQVLAELRAYLEQTPRVTRLRIEGHTSNVRPPEQSLELSGERARAVKQWLLSRGIPEQRLLAVGFGDMQPIASNADPAGQAQNERIELRIAELDGKLYLAADPLAGGTEFP